ncbi:MAG: hypothetical protein ACQES2_00710 [Pseudomonadota bacterium]
MMATDGEIRTRYAVGEHLQKTMDEIDAMTVLEFHGWVEFIKMKRAQQK